MFSVVIPSYNHAAYLDEALLSALDSKFVSEILIADDGSSDTSVHIINAWSSRHPDMIKNLTLIPIENKGADATLNRLIEAAESEWIAVLNSDDKFSSSRFSFIYENLKLFDFDFCFGNLLIMDAFSNIVGRKRAFLDPQYPFPPSSTAGVLDSFRLLASQNYIATTTNMVFKKSLWKKIGGFANYRYCHDWDFALRAHSFGRARYIPEYLSVYRVHGSNTISELSTEAQSVEVRKMLMRVNEDMEGSFFQMFEAEIKANEYMK